MATDFTNSTGMPQRGTLVPKHAPDMNVYESQTVPPASPGLPANRQNVPQERLGAQYRVTVGVPAPVMIEASATQANGRIVPSSVMREGNFGDAMMDAIRQ
jgi:hypothetical protein